MQPIGEVRVLGSGLRLAKGNTASPGRSPKAGRMSRCQACCALTVSPTAIASAIQNDGMRQKGAADRADGNPATIAGAGTTPVSRRRPERARDRTTRRARARAAGRARRRRSPHAPTTPADRTGGRPYRRPRPQAKRARRTRLRRETPVAGEVPRRRTWRMSPRVGQKQDRSKPVSVNKSRHRRTRSRRSQRAN